MPRPRRDRGRRRLAGAALLFAALGDPTRLMLVQRLSGEGPASISLLAERFAMTRQGVTKHLRVLEAAGVIAGERQGREHVWALNPASLADARETLSRIAAGWHDALRRLKWQLEREREV